MPLTPLACSEIVLRAIRSKGWLDQYERVNANAFIRRPSEADGLSVNIHSKTPDVTVWLSSFRASFGADSLHPGRVRNIGLGLDVGQTETDLQVRPDHAVITGVPFQDDDPPRAERIASELAKISRTVDRTRRRSR